MRKRYLFRHDPSDSVFVANLTEHEHFKLMETADGSQCDDVTGVSIWEKRYERELKEMNLKGNNARIIKDGNFMDLKRLAPALMLMAQAFEAASNAVMGEDETEQEEVAPKTTKKVTKKAPGKKAPPVEEEEEETPEETEEENNEDFEQEEEQEEKAPEIADVRKALMAYANKHSKEKAFAIMAKSIPKGKENLAKNLKVTDYAKVIAALKVK